MKVRITYQGTVYELDVEILDGLDQVRPVTAAAATPPPLPATGSVEPSPSAAPAKQKPSGELGRTVNSPMAGVVLAVKVRPGDEVREGQDVVTLEAMKMETTIVSPFAGTVKAILVSPKQGVDSDEPLIQFE